MKIRYALQPLEKSIFLAGPTPRPELGGISWRPEALEILKELEFDGTVFVPETEDYAPHDHYDDQINWEWEAINQATVVAFWVPRDLRVFPAFTTNVEFGLLANSGKLVLGYPAEAPKMKYLAKLGERFGIHAQSSLRDTLAEAVKIANGVFGAPA